MVQINELKTYSDDRGNSIVYEGPTIASGIKIVFTGSGNQLYVEAPTRIDRLSVQFDCNNATVQVGLNDRKHGSHLRLNVRAGEDALISVGRYVTMTNSCYMTAAEGGKIIVGDDCMFASNNALRGHDSHPIFDISTKLRANPSRDIVIGNHVWLGVEAVALGGAEIGDGSVIGLRGVVTSKISNNSIAVGVPARVIRKNVAWERPNLTLTRPYYKPDASTIEVSEYWRQTNEPETVSFGKKLMRRFGSMFK